MVDHSRFANIGFEDFRRLATDHSLTKYERIGFPDSYRHGYEEAIFADLLTKLPALEERGRVLVDIGPGCSDLPRMVIQACQGRGNRLYLIDSPEMLAHLPDAPMVEKVSARFPACPALMSELAGKADGVICYSVLHYVFAEGALFPFLDAALSLLAPGGRLIVGDVPNVSKRKRFFASARGIAFHKAFMETSEEPRVEFNCLEPGHIDDPVILSLLARARAAGFDGYVMPQPESLPMANRREDLLFVRP